MHTSGALVVLCPPSLIPEGLRDPPEVLAFPAVLCLGRARVDAARRSVLAAQERLGENFVHYSQNCAAVTMALGFLPIFVAGLFLGTLVVVGQGSKEGTMQVRRASSRSFGGCFDVFRQYVM